MDNNEPGSKQNADRILIALIASAVTALGVWLSLDVVAICQAVINGS